MRRSVSKSKSPARNAATVRNNTRSSSNPKRVTMKARKFAGSSKNSIEQYQPSILKGRKSSALNAHSPTQSKKNTMVSGNTLMNSKTTTSQTTRSGRPGADTSMTVRKVSLFNIDERNSRSPGMRGRSTSLKKRSTSTKARKASRSVGDKQGAAESPRRNRSRSKLDQAQQICRETNLRKSGYPIAIQKSQVYPVEVHGRKHLSRKRGKKKIDSFSAQM